MPSGSSPDGNGPKENQVATIVRYSMTVAALAAVALAAAQEPLRAPTLQERVAALETAVATIETRFGLESARPGNLGTGESGVALAGRVDALQRSVDDRSSGSRARCSASSASPIARRAMRHKHSATPRRRSRRLATPRCVRASNAASGRSSRSRRRIFRTELRCSRWLSASASRRPGFRSPAV
jgi:hypothetical protein